MPKVSAKRSDREAKRMHALKIVPLRASSVRKTQHCGVLQTMPTSMQTRVHVRASVRHLLNCDRPFQSEMTSHFRHMCCTVLRSCLI
eukprot:4483976-Pleurochrysis_carterae.AAC.5